MPSPRADELCAAPIGRAKEWLGTVRKSVLAISSSHAIRSGGARRGSVGNAPPGWRLFRDEPWPGMTLLVDTRAGGYDESLGFTGDSKHVPTPVAGSPGTAVAWASPSGADEDSHDEDPRSAIGCGAAHRSSRACRHGGRGSLPRSRRRHRDPRGPSFGRLAGTIWARRTRSSRTPCGGASPSLMRAETGSLRRQPGRTCVMLAPSFGTSSPRPSRSSTKRLVARRRSRGLSDRCPSREGTYEPSGTAARTGANGRAGRRTLRPRGMGGRRAAERRMGAGECWAGGALTLSVMELGWDEATRESWTERTRDLLERFGPFRLAWMETIVRLADWRASAKEREGSDGDI